MCVNLPLVDPAQIDTPVLIMRGAWRLVRESVDVLLESTPSHIWPSVQSSFESHFG